MMIGGTLFPDVDAATGIAASSVSVIVRGGYCHKPYEELNVKMHHQLLLDSFGWMEENVAGHYR